MFPTIDLKSSKVRMLPVLLLALLFLFWGAQIVRAQTEVPDGAAPGPIVHVVAEGENLTVIAQQYDVSVEAVRLVNHLRNADVLVVGRELIIPGGEGELVAAVADVQLGDSMTSIARSFNTTIDALLEANLLINRDYVPAFGQSLSVISRTGTDQPEPIRGFPHVVERGQTILEIAAQYGLSAAEIAKVNGLSFPIRLYPGQRLRIPSDEVYQDLPGRWKRVTLRPQNIVQGDTVVIYVEHFLDGRPSGEFAGQTLNFVPFHDGYAALVGFDAFTPPGAYTLKLAGDGDQVWQEFSQDIPIQSANYINQLITVPEELNGLLDPEIRDQEDQQLLDIYSNFTDEARWDGLFQVPVTNTIVTAPYGGGRSYNEGPVTTYHTGTDFSGDIGTPILAAANGTVVFNDTLELRGQTVIVDHGLGVMTGYYHLSETFVEIGQEVFVGEPIGLGGSTGLSTGPHLHWDLRIMGVPVNGMRWTEELFP